MWGKKARKKKEKKLADPVEPYNVALEVCIVQVGDG